MQHLEREKVKSWCLVCRVTMEALVHEERTDLRGSRVNQDLWENRELRASLEKRWDVRKIEQHHTNESKTDWTSEHMALCCCSVPNVGAKLLQNHFACRLFNHPAATCALI